MKLRLPPLFLAAGALLLASCAATSLKQIWKAPEFAGSPAGRVAVLGVDERGLIRQGFENRFARQLQGRGQAAVVTYDLLSLPQIKEDRSAAAARLRETGADAILIVRLVDVATYAREMRTTNERYISGVTGIESYDWYNFYSVAFMDMGSTYGTLSQKVYLDVSLYSLDAGKRFWSCQAELVVKEKTDRVDLVDALVAKVVAAMAKDGVVR
jgi:hypothetical protein